ncbi:hypothetical protein OQA88_884 [Cercophora sp. LCS_1]
MLVRDIKRTALFVAPLFVLLLITYSLWDPETTEQIQSHVDSFLGKAPPSDDVAPPKESAPAPSFGITTPFPPDSPPEEPPAAPPSAAPLPPPASNPDSPASGTIPSGTNIFLPEADPSAGTHREIFDVYTPDRKFFPITFANYSVFNPNIIPHPTLDDTYIIVGQKSQDTVNDPEATFYEIACNAKFTDGTLKCVNDEAIILPISPTTGDTSKCTGEIELLNMNKGPHDARVFYGLKKPYITFGSNSMFACFGQWMQDFRTLVDWGVDMVQNDNFVSPVDLQRPEPWSAVEKNWFVFWDKDNQMYAHYDSTPSRSFAPLYDNGTAGPNLGPFAAEQDEKCLAHYLPKLPETNESIHQATNSLRITTCNRADKDCKATDANTVIITIIQHKTWYDWHGEYEPYVVAFRERSPFEVHAISEKPLWIYGRERIDEKKAELLYVVSLNWKDRGRKYHGFLDDDIFLAFGIEDKKAGGMTVKAADLLKGMGLCSDVPLLALAP